MIKGSAGCGRGKAGTVKDIAGVVICRDGLEGGIAGRKAGITGTEMIKGKKLAGIHENGEKTRRKDAAGPKRSISGGRKKDAGTTKSVTGMKKS
jgi:hypothetical protein